MDALLGIGKGGGKTQTPPHQTPPQTQTPLKGGSLSFALAQSCLCVFEKILEADSTTSDLLIQYILAPPPPMGMMADEEEEDMPAEMQPLGSVVINLLVEG